MTKLICLFALLSLLVSTASSAAEVVPMIVCKESATWTRPSPEVQAKIWNDSRYSSSGASDPEWTRNFHVVPPHSASIQYHLENTSGLWTEGVFSPTCENDRKGTEWLAVWALLHRVKSISLVNSTYTIEVEPTKSGFQTVLFKRLHVSATFRFVSQHGELIEEIFEQPVGN